MYITTALKAVTFPDISGLPVSWEVGDSKLIREEDILRISKMPDIFTPPTGWPFEKSADYTVQVGSFETIEDALAHLQMFTYTSGAKKILQLSSGDYAFLDNALIDGVTIVGQAPIPLTITSIQSTSGTAGAWTVVVNVTEPVTGVAINDVIGIGGCTGGTRPLLLTGAFEVAAVNTANRRLTFTLNSAYTVGAPSGAVTGSAVVFKTKINLPSEVKSKVEISDLSVSGANIVLGGSVRALTPCAFRQACFANLGGYLYGDACYYGNGGVSCQYSGGAHIDNAFVGNTSSGGAQALVLSGEGSSVSAWGTDIVGGDIGAFAYMGSTISSHGGDVAYNTLGCKAAHGSVIDAYTSTFTGNTTNTSPAAFNTVGNVGAYVSNTDPSA